jgi:putative transcriptional regulator
MIRKKQSARRSGPSKKNSLTELILDGLNEGLAHARGEAKLRKRTIQIPSAVNVRALRAQLKMSQAEFAARYGFSLRTIQEWEQRRAVPDSAVRAYLTVIQRNPQAVLDALSAA